MKYKIIVDKQSRKNPSNERKEYIIDIEELRAKGDIYDSLTITKNEDYVIRRLSLSEYNVLSILDEPIKEPIPDLNIELFEGDNYIYLMDMQGNKFYAEYLVKNDFTDMYVTRNEMNSSINQTAQNIELSVNQKLVGYATTEEMNSAIEVKSGEITSAVSKTYTTKEELNTAKSEIKQTTDNITSTVSKKVGNNEIISKINQSAENIQIDADKIDINGKAVHFKTNISTTVGPFTNNDINKIRNYIMGTGTLTSEEIKKYDINGDGMITSSDYALVAKAVVNGGKLNYTGTFEINPYSANKAITLHNSNKYTLILSLIYNYISFLYTDGLNINGQLVVENNYGRMFTQESEGMFELYVDGNIRSENKITCNNLVQTSLENKKKNFEKMQDNALNIIKNIDIYRYNLKSEKDTDKKHIGFVIGDDYNYSKEVTSTDNQGVDNYSFTSLCCKAIQELAEQNKQLQQKIEILEKEAKNG